MKSLHMVSFVLVVVGGLNWLLVAFGYNLVDSLLGEGSMLAKLVYILVGLSAVLLVVTHKSSCKHCVSGGTEGQM